MIVCRYNISLKTKRAIFASVLGKLSTVIFVKIVSQVAILMIIALFILLFIYPILHESGHILAALLIGIIPSRVELFPIAHVVVPIKEYSLGQATLMFGAGYWFPPMVIAMLRGNYYFYFSRLTVLLLTLVSAVSSMVSVIRLPYGGENAFDDITQLLQLFPEQQEFAVLFLSISIVLLMLAIVLSHPLSKMVDFFEKKKSNKRKYLFAELIVLLSKKALI